MFECLDIIVKHIKEFKDESQRKELLKLAIIAEAKHNNDLSEIICYSNADKIAREIPEIFNQFSVSTSELLLMSGIPAYKVLGDANHPKEDNIREMDKSSVKYKLFENKSASELYEFYIRKCNVLKSLYSGHALNLVKISLQRRCKNIGYATKSLVIKYQ